MDYELTTRQVYAIISLLQDGKKTRAARAAGVHRDTIYEWLKQPSFTSAYQECRQAQQEQLQQKLQRIIKGNY